MLHAPLFPDPLLPGNIRRLALLIDAENVPRDRVAAIVAATAGHGVVDIRRAYGDWAGGGLKAWGATLHDHAIRPVQQLSYTAGKNASDIALVIDAMELLHIGRLDGFCLASSDADFTPLVMHLRERGRDVHGFGESKTPRAFVRACTSFVDLGKLPSALPDAGSVATIAIPPEAPVSLHPLSSDTRLVSMLRAAVKAATKENGWASLSAIGQHAKGAGVDPKAHGCSNLTALYTAINLFESKRDKAGHLLLREAASQR